MCDRATHNGLGYSTIVIKYMEKPGESLMQKWPLHLNCSRIRTTRNYMYILPICWPGCEGTCIEWHHAYSTLTHWHKKHTSLLHNTCTCSYVMINYQAYGIAPTAHVMANGKGNLIHVHVWRWSRRYYMYNKEPHVTSVREIQCMDMCDIL